MTRSVDDRLGDILTAIAGARVADERLQVVGQAVKALPDTLLEGNPDTPWSEIAAMRDVIGHHYHRIVPAIIHGTIEHDLGPLEATVRRLRESLRR